MELTERRNDWIPDEERLARETADLLRFGTQLLMGVSAVAATVLAGALVMAVG